MSEQQAFVEELLKISSAGGAAGAGLRGLWQGTKAVGRRFANPIQGAKEGLKTLSPLGILAGGGARAQQLRSRVQQAQSGGVFKRTFGAGGHLIEDSKPLNGLGVRGSAEELSRRGWTGGSKATKYLPVGDKAQLALLGPGAVAYDAMTDTPGDDRGTGEKVIGGLGFAGSSLLTAGMGLPGFLTDMAVGELASRGGRALDHRAGDATELRNRRAVLVRKAMQEARERGA